MYSFISLSRIRFGLAVVISGFIGCTPAAENPQPGNVQKGYLTGKVTDSKGKPIRGVRVIADNTFLYNSNLLGTTNANGLYSIKLSAGTYLATAELTVDYNTRSYKLNLRPDATEEFIQQDGAVRNFSWALTGPRPEQPRLHYGGDIMLNRVVGSSLYDVENIVFTLVPVGPLIDGSEGSTLRLRSGQPSTETYGQLADVPIGRYKISAVHEPTGTKVKVRNGVNGTFSADGSVTMDFYGETSPRFCTNCMILEYRE